MMKQAIGDFPLAIASGITPENVKDYLEVADCFLVATGISNSFSELSPVRVRELVRNIRLFEGVAPETARGPGSSKTAATPARRRGDPTATSCATPRDGRRPGAAEGPKPPGV